MQTLRSRVLPPAAPTDGVAATRTLRVAMNDGTPDELGVALHTPRTPREDEASPSLVVLIHGLGGSSESAYILSTAGHLLRAGVAVARLDLRGAGRAGQPSQQMYHAGRTSDVRRVLHALLDEPEAATPRGRRGLGMVGFSLGGNVTLKLLGEGVDEFPVDAAVAVSAPLDLAAGSEYLHHVAFGLYERAMVRGLRADVARFAGAMSDRERAAIAAARRIEEFDDAFTARQSGWRDAAEYYAVNSCAQYLPRIDVPTLLVHALDDPVVPSGPYRAVDWDGLEQRGFVRRAVTAHGGHVGFHQRGGRPPWYVEQVVAFMTSRE
jgi:predicted alpha/beta-fold hydrolase